MTDRKKHGVAFWATVALVVVLVGYPLSWGPAIWLERSGYMPSKAALDAQHAVYYPLWWIRQHDEWLGRVLTAYLKLWVDF